MAALQTPAGALGWRAKDFTLEDAYGDPFRLSDLKGSSGTLVMFICNHCPYVRALADRIARDAFDLQKGGVGVIAVMPNTPKPPFGWNPYSRLAFSPWKFVRRNCVLMRKMLAAAGVLALAVGFGSPAFSAKESVDAKFSAQAAKDGMAEVELGKLALDKSNDARVREFADRMIQDHSKANRQLESIAGSKNISLPSKPGEKLQKPMKKLSGLSGKNFDHAYAEAMVKDHEKAVKLFQQCERECTNDELREFAKQTLPILREHLTMARKMVGT